MEKNEPFEQELKNVFDVVEKILSSEDEFETAKTRELLLHLLEDPDLPKIEELKGKAGRDYPKNYPALLSLFTHKDPNVRDLTRLAICLHLLPRTPAFNLRNSIWEMKSEILDLDFDRRDKIALLRDDGRLFRIMLMVLPFLKFQQVNLGRYPDSYDAFFKYRITREGRLSRENFLKSVEMKTNDFVAQRIFKKWQDLYDTNSDPTVWRELGEIEKVEITKKIFDYMSRYVELNEKYNLRTAEETGDFLIRNAKWFMEHDAPEYALVCYRQMDPKYSGHQEGCIQAFLLSYQGHLDPKHQALTNAKLAAFVEAFPYCLDLKNHLAKFEKENMHVLDGYLSGAVGYKLGPAEVKEISSSTRLTLLEYALLKDINNTSSSASDPAFLGKSSGKPLLKLPHFKTIDELVKNEDQIDSIFNSLQSSGLNDNQKSLFDAIAILRADLKVSSKVSPPEISSAEPGMGQK